MKRATFWVSTASLLVFATAATAGDIKVLAIDLATKSPVKATASYETGLKFKWSPRYLSLALDDSVRQCSGKIEMDPETTKSRGSTYKPAEYDSHNKLVKQAGVDNTTSVTTTGHQGVSQLQCSDGQILLCQLSAGVKVTKSLDGICASLDEKLQYRILAQTN
jgi:hypothetical protein